MLIGKSIAAKPAVKMGLISEPSEAAARQHTPKVAIVAPTVVIGVRGGECLGCIVVNLSRADLCGA